MLYPLQSVFCLPCIYREKNEVVDEHELDRGQNQPLQIYGGPKIQTSQRILVSMERLVFSLFSSFVSCGSIGLSGYRCVKGSPILDRGVRQYFSSKMSISIINVAVTNSWLGLIIFS